MDPVRAACRELLRARGPMPLGELATHLVADGHELSGDLDALDDHLFPFEEPEWSPSELADGRLADADDLLDGLVLTTVHGRAGPTGASRGLARPGPVGALVGRHGDAAGIWCSSCVHAIRWP